MTIRVKLDEFMETMRQLKEAGRVINYAEDRYTFDKDGLLVRIEKEISFR